MELAIGVRRPREAKKTWGKKGRGLKFCSLWCGSILKQLGGVFMKRTQWVLGCWGGVLYFVTDR